MHDEQEELVPEFQDWFDGADIFFRSKDKQRFQLSLEAVSHGDRGLAVIGGNDGVLDHSISRVFNWRCFYPTIPTACSTDSIKYSPR